LGSSAVLWFAARVREQRDDQN